MKYIVTENSIIVSVNGMTYIADSTHKHFDEIKIAIENKSDDSDILYLFNKEYIDMAKDMLMKTGGKLTIDLKA